MYLPVQKQIKLFRINTSKIQANTIFNHVDLFCRIFRKNITLDEAETQNIAATISLVNKKIQNKYAKIKYYESLMENVSKDLRKDIKFNEILHGRHEHLSSQYLQKE